MKNFFLFLAIFSLFFSAEEAAAKIKKKKIFTKIYPEISAEYFLQIDLLQNECEKFLDVSVENKTACFRRDGMRDEPYFHKSKITIFNGKIFAEQFFSGGKDQVFLRVRNGGYKLVNRGGNLISFSVQNGFVSDLKLLKGDLSKEKKLESKCDENEAIYGFYQANDKSGIVQKNIIFSDEFGPSGLKELQIFIEKSNPEKAMAISSDPNNNAASIDDVRLCRMPDSQEYFLRRISDESCELNRDETIQECTKYSACKNYLIVKNCEVSFLKDLLTWPDPSR
jgi:hypothetical protein